LKFSRVFGHGVRVLRRLSGLVATDEEFDGIDDDEERSPLEIPEDISDSSSVVELPGKDYTEREDTSEDRKRVETVLINLGDDKVPRQVSTELNHSESGAHLPLAVEEDWVYKLTCHVDVEGDEDAVDNGDAIIGLGDTFFVLTIPVSEMKNDKTETCEGEEFNDHSSKTQARTDLPSIRVRAKKLSRACYHQCHSERRKYLLPEY